MEIRRRKVKERLDMLKEGKTFTIANLNIHLYDEDYIFIYDKPGGVLQYSCKFKDIDSVPQELQEMEYIKDSIIRLNNDDPIPKEKLGCVGFKTKPYAVTIYLGGPDRVEKGIQNRAYYI